jgi:hypothetical protein
VKNNNDVLHKRLVVSKINAHNKRMELELDVLHKRLVVSKINAHNKRMELELALLDEEAKLMVTP